MSDHPCPLPRPRPWRWGRSWVCSTCGREWWLVERWRYDDPSDAWSEWVWVDGDDPITPQMNWRPWERPDREGHR